MSNQAPRKSLNIDPRNEGSQDLSIAQETGLRHVAIIMDGNGRWAKARNLDHYDGHREGVAAARRAIEAARDFGIDYLTLYSFSTENWKRPKGEVIHLMGLLKDFITADLPTLVKENVRVRIIGDKQTLPADIKMLVQRAEKDTATNTGSTLQIAFNYGSRDEISRAVKRLAQDYAAGDLTLEEITPDLIGGALDTAGIPDPDLVIRTSGEHRVSNFLLWQAAYAEYVFLEEFWPEFDEHLFLKAIEHYCDRDRRFGGR